MNRQVLGKQRLGSPEALSSRLPAARRIRGVAGRTQPAIHPVAATSALGRGAGPSLRAQRGRQRTLGVSCEAGSAEKTDYRTKKPEDVSVMVAGGTGYIGRAVVKELVSRGYNTIVLAREKSGIGGAEGKQETTKRFGGTKVEFGDVTDTASVGAALANHDVDVFISCLASRTGGKKDSWLIDYQATKNCLDEAVKAGASHFVLLSAICVQKPLLEFQHAKLKFEDELMASKDITHSIVRPTAFFKSLAGQVESVKKGGPYVYFGEGDLCACKPISERVRHPNPLPPLSLFLSHSRSRSLRSRPTDS